MRSSTPQLHYRVALLFDAGLGGKCGVSWIGNVGCWGKEGRFSHRPMTRFGRFFYRSVCSPIVSFRELSRPGGISNCLDLSSPAGTALFSEWLSQAAGRMKNHLYPLCFALRCSAAAKEKKEKQNHVVCAPQCA
jgi:hypothetical protein